MADSRIDCDIDTTQFEACVAEQRELTALLEKEKPATSPNRTALGLFSSPVSLPVEVTIEKDSLIDDAEKLLLEKKAWH